ncbi:hypothetical protein HA402_005484 [Bradysia odoriphaga]|nr:hypothetical protein HA402_005484 [Bradysia odoriphaga]
METLLDKGRLDNYISNLNDEILNGDFEVIFRNAPLPKDSLCGIGPLHGRFLQKCANKKSFIFVFGIVGLIFASSHAYYNGTITTMEKRFKIPSAKMGFIATGNDITGFLLSMFIAYYGGRGHRPRWMAVGILTIVIYCLMNVIPHFLYGPGEDALLLTVEHGAVKDDEKTKAVQETDNNLLTCRHNATEASDTIPCQNDDGNMVAQICLFGAQLIAGIGQTLKHTLGISYLDDNIKKSKTPALLSISYFIRLLGPAAGYALASLCLNFYIAPDLTPVISNKDPRWLGAWYFGWIFIALILLSFTVVMAMFPRELPRAAVRKRIAMEKQKRANKHEMTPLVEETEASIKDFYITFKRLLRNKVFMLNNFAGIFYVFGFMPFWIFSPKLIETLFKQSSSASSLFTGTFALISSAAGILIAGIIITKFKPSARYLAFWNVIVGLLSVLSILSFSLMGCDEGKNAIHTSVGVSPLSCNELCNCDFVKYSPVCGADGVTYVSPCHAGCTRATFINKTKRFDECACIDADVEYKLSEDYSIDQHQALQGPCPVDCQSKLTIFLIVICFMKFIGSTGRASNFLVGIRCVEERDKTLAIGFGMTLIRLLAAVPSPIFFGYIIDHACIAWGRTCTSKGNCWLYDTEMLRYAFFYTSAFAIAIGTIFDVLVWKHSKNLKIFDDDDDNVGVNVGKNVDNANGNK